MSSPLKVRGEFNLSYGQDSAFKDDRNIVTNSEQNMSNINYSNDLQISPNKSSKNIRLFHKPNHSMKTLPISHQKKPSIQLQSFTDREERQNNIHLLTNTFTKETDKIAYNQTPNSSNPKTKSQTYFPSSNTKYGQNLQFRSPITSQTSSRQNIQNGELSTGNELDTIKSNNSNLPNLQLYDQLYNQKNSAYFQTNEFSISQQKNQIHQKGLSVDGLLKSNKSQPELFQTPDIFKEKYNQQQAQTQQKFFQIRQPKQDIQTDATFLKGPQSVKNFSMNQETSLSPNPMIKRKLDFRSQNEKKEDKDEIIQISQEKKFNLILNVKEQTFSNIPAFFQCVQILSEEIEYLTQSHENQINQIQQEKEKIIQENSSLKQKYQAQQAETATVAQQTENVINKQNKIPQQTQNKQIEIYKKIETLIKQQEEFQKEIQMTKEQLRQSKFETEKQMRNQIQQKNSDFQQQINSQQNEIQSKNENIQLQTQQIEDNQLQLEQQTPRPRLDSFFKLFEQGGDNSFSMEEKELNTKEKVEILFQKAQQVVMDLKEKEEESLKKSFSKSKSQNRIKSQQNSKDFKSSPPKQRNPAIKPTYGLKQQNSIHINSGGSSTSITTKNPKDIFIKATNEIKQRLKQKKLLDKKGAQDSEQIDIFTLPGSNVNNNSTIANQQQRLSTFSKSNRSISRKASNVYSLQRQNSRATLASFDSLDIGERGRNKKSENISQSQLEQISSFNEDTIAQGGFKRQNKSRAQTNLTKKKTVVFEEVR